MLITDDIFRFYDYFYNRKYSTPEQKLNKTPTNTKQVQALLDTIKKGYGDAANKEFLYTYFLFQFQYWDKVEFTGTSSYNTGIQLSFIVGKKAFERYSKRNQDYDWQLDSLPIIKKYGLRKSDLIKTIGQLTTKHKIEVKRGVDTEAATKLAFYNTLEGYNVCGDHSTLYNHKSSICEGCNYKAECKTRLQKMYPTLYMDRGYK